MMDSNGKQFIWRIITIIIVMIIAITMDSMKVEIIVTLCYMNIDPKNHPLSVGTNLPIPICQGLC